MFNVNIFGISKKNMAKDNKLINGISTKDMNLKNMFEV
jgi:hypothetical protein